MGDAPSFDDLIIILTRRDKRIKQLVDENKELKKVELPREWNKGYSIGQGKLKEPYDKQIEKLKEEKTVAWTLGYSAGTKDANKTADVRVKELEKELKTICELRNNLIDEHKALKEFIRSIKCQLDVMNAKL